MKRIVVYLLISVLAGSSLIMGCSAVNSATTESSSEEMTETVPVYADQSFITDLSIGLMNRWDIVEEENKKISDGTLIRGSSEEKQGLIACINAELEMVDKYRNEPFEDSNLQELAISYINALNDQLKSLDDFNTTACDEKWQAAYDKRSKILSTLVNDYNLSVDEAHQDMLQQFNSYGNQVKKVEETQGKIDELLNSFDFEETNNDYGYKTYNAIVENTTGIDFDTFSININLLDEDGVLIETAYASFNNWSSGVKAKFEFISDKDFSSTEVHSDYIIDSNKVVYK